MGPTEGNGGDYEKPQRSVDLLDAFRLANRGLQEALHAGRSDGEDGDLCLVGDHEEGDKLEIGRMGSGRQVFRVG